MRACSPPLPSPQGVALRNDISARLTAITALTTERYHEHTADRKSKREVR